MPNEATDARIASRIREAREYLELSTEELAQMLGIETEQVEGIEQGQTSVSASLLAEFSKVLGRGLEYFTADVPAAQVSERTEFLARAAETLSDQDIGELERFANYLRSRSTSPAA